MAKPSEGQRCLEIWKAGIDICSIPKREKRREELKKFLVFAESEAGFETEQFAAKCDISWVDSLIVSVLFLLIMGGPLFLVASFFLLLLLGSWTSLICHVLFTLFLCFHPLPKHSPDNVMHPVCLRISVAVFRYFTHRVMWSGDAWEKVTSGDAWIGAAPPHGALPIANLLCMPSINIGTRNFVGAPASVVFNTPFLRYILLLGSCTVSGDSMVAATKRGEAVGMCPDGIAGIFTTNPSEELVALKNRKGLARLMLRTGTPLLPAYSIGNTAAFKVWYDSFGIMEAVSRALKVSIFLPYGRWGLPIPFRANITMIFGTPIQVSKVPEGTQPTQEQVDELHERILDATANLFNTHKASLGWQNRTLKFI